MTKKANKINTFGSKKKYFLKFSSIVEYSIFFWLILITVMGIFVSNIYSTNKLKKAEQIKATFDNTYLKKTIFNLTKSLEPRYSIKNYISKSGDTYEAILDKLKINNEKKKKLLDAISKENSLKILRINQKFTFKIDHLLDDEIVQFNIETDKKNEILFTKKITEKEYDIKKIQKNFTKNFVYKETIITNSLYNSAINLGIKPNIIIEFARLYGFQVDFQRDIWKNDSFQIIYEEFVNDENMIVDTGEIIFASLNLQDNDLQLYKYEYEKNKIDYFDENGKSIKKTLMKTPINGARLSSSYGKRKHPILGYTKMHTGTDFAAPKGTPIMASGDGKVTKAGWCGGGGNCVKIKHNRHIKLFMLICQNLDEV